MASVDAAIAALWGAFGLYWLVSAFSAKRTARGRRRHPLGIIVAAGVVLLVRGLARGSVPTHGPALHAGGIAVLAAGLALAVWARIHLGRNWGMPMTERVEPELVTSGPYRRIRHPIYTGILLGLLGTALAANLAVLVVLAVATAYFVWCARVEERTMAATFPDAYPAYMARTKMLVPFVL